MRARRCRTRRRTPRPRPSANPAGQLRGYMLPDVVATRVPTMPPPLRHLVKTTRPITHSASGGYASGRWFVSTPAEGGEGQHRPFLVGGCNQASTESLQHCQIFCSTVDPWRAS